jgi:uncharacterized protein involved in response to NO
LNQHADSRLQIFFSLGFRPFFFGAGLFAASSMLLWLIALRQPDVLPDQTTAVLWHVHEMLFGYLGAVISGFLLTAVPNWTNRPPLTGVRLASLFFVWLLARLANVLLPVSFWSALLDCLLLFGVATYLWVQVIAARNHRNLIVAVVISVFMAAHALWYWELLGKGFPDWSLRLTLTALASLLTLIGGRLVPNFSRNWLRQRGGSILPAPDSPFDLFCVVATLASLLVWCIAPRTIAASSTLLVAGLLNAVRLYRWRGWLTVAEPLVLVLHVGYLWLPVAFLLLGAEIIRPDLFPRGAAIHALTAGAAGVMTIAVMTRATLGHSGRPLTADRGTVLVYVLVVAAALARIVASYPGTSSYEMHLLAGLLWTAGFGVFCVLYSRYFLTSS